LSHIVTIDIEVRDVAALRAACNRLGLPAPEEREVKLFSGTKTGHAVRFPGWRYPAVCDLTTGEVHYDNYQGRWGDQKHLDAFKQAYAVEKAKLEARKKGYPVTERKLDNGEIRLEVRVP
jgi:hypothetical protein